ncbi:MAG: radical SAM protein [Proteobacteria bacterium]|nr:radical SAM protein [Pseudomonadota bacterium]MBU1232426.1 radical SAM protein [Pseudomonadota bacterium]MBU1417213.1 radical SAM protein [Pseudomonadota bacterium]MBU1453613.1 radical SAM protein [Pseudomonadota bacterium]
MLLIHPPLAKACEPPAGITRLAGALRGNNQDCTLWDANLEAQLFLLKQPQVPVDTWGKRAWRNVQPNLTKLRRPQLYENSDRYQRAIIDVNRALSQSIDQPGITISLANYQDEAFSPLRSEDLLRAAEEYERNPFFPFFQNRVPELLAKARGEWIGISLNYLSQALPAFALIGFLKNKYPDFSLILGGGLITSWLRSPSWENPFAELIDRLVAGPGEESLLEILGKTSDSNYSQPDFSGLPLQDYLAPGLILPYSASTGCYWNRCSFCPEKAEGAPYTRISADQVMADITALVSASQPRLIHFLDNAVSPALMKRLSLQPPGPAWYGFARVSPELCSPDFCMGLRRSGCVMLKLGIESGSQEVLTAMDKGIDLQMVEEALSGLAAAGIATYVYLLFGTPSESIYEARQTLDFTVRHADAISFLNLAIFNLPRNSPESNDLALHDFSAADLALYTDFHHPRDWNRKAVRNFLSTEFKPHPAIRQILQRDPPFYTSNHAPFFG